MTEKKTEADSDEKRLLHLREALVAAQGKVNEIQSGIDAIEAKAEAAAYDAMTDDERNAAQRQADKIAAAVKRGQMAAL